MSFVHLLRRRLYTIGLLLGLLLFGRQLWILYQGLPVSYFASITLPPLLLAFALYILGYLIQIVAWWLLMGYLGHSLPLRPIIEGYLLSFLPRYIPGSVWGYLGRNEWLSQQYQVPYSVSSLASVIETLSFLIGALGLLLLWMTPLPLRFITLMGLIVTLCMIWILSPWVYARFVRVELPSTPVTPSKLWSQAAILLAGSTLYALFWVVHGAALIAVAWATSSHYQIDLGTASFAASLAWSIGFLTLIAPAGLGVRETTLVSLLTTSAALSDSDAALIAVVSRVMLIGAEVTLILISFTLNRLSLRFFSRNTSKGG